MPPSAQRRTRTRKAADLVEKSDAEEFDSAATPSRKRRKVNNDSPAPVLPTEARSELAGRRHKNGPAEIKIYEEESSITEEDIDTVIRNLRTAKYNVQARVDYANELHEVAHPEGKEAYAKIAGNSWTFYVNELEIRIGRPPDDRQADGQSIHNGDGRIHDKSLVHIDLGPSKLVSRQHAVIRFNEISGQWYITVNGRNGIKIDDIQLGRGESSNLLSGNVVDVAGTQMMFVTPNVVPVIHPTILAQTHAQREDKSEEEDDTGTHNQTTLPSQRTPTRGPGSRTNGKNRPPSSNDRYSNQQQSNSKQVPHSARSFSATFSALHDSMRGSPSTATKETPSYSRVLMLESGEDIDYGLDTAKDFKPPHSYAQLIGMAILSSPEEKLTLSKIYEWIKERYAFYRFSGGGWQNSIRHNLSLNKCFEKIARRTDEPGKGMKWQIVAEHRDEFLKKGLSSAKKSRGSSGPNSPIKMSLSAMDGDKRFDNPFLQDPQRGASRMGNPFVKTSPGSTPPMAHYPVPKEAYTPDRGGLALRHIQGLDPSSPRNGFPLGASPLPPYGNRSRHYLNGFNETAATGSPGGPTMLLSSEAQDHLVTPLITRHLPRLAPPSTAHLPSQFMPMSSPAPFWKYADFGSTPARPNVDISPVKMTMRPESKKAQEEQDESPVEVPEPQRNGKNALVHSSSPPLPETEVGSGSPTRALSNRGGDKVQPQAPPPKLVLSDAHLLPRPHAVQQHMNNVPRSSIPSAIQQDDDDDDEEEGMIDLARGFQPIGAFHRNIAGGIRGN